MMRQSKPIFYVAISCLFLWACSAQQQATHQIQETHPDNLLRDSEILLRQTYWSPSSSRIHVVAGSPSHSGYFAYSGSGGRSGFEYVGSTPIVVEPDKTYTLSGDIDATKVLSGRPEWAVLDKSLRRVIAVTYIDSGFSSRVAQSFQMPAGIREVHVLCDTVNSVVAPGGVLKFAHPTLVLGDSAEYFVSSTPRPH